MSKTLKSGVIFLGCLLWGWCGVAMAQGECPDRLVGDSLAVGMGQAVQVPGMEVVAVRGSGEAWLGNMTSRFNGCSRTVVLFLGTNDLKAIKSVEQGAAYLKRVVAKAQGLRHQQLVWVLPGCFSGRGLEGLERGSAFLDRALEAGALASERTKVVRMRKSWCQAPGGDGIHYSAAEYQQIWGLVVNSSR